MILSDKERIEWFWARVHKTSSCWLYKGAKSRGYGHFYHNKVHQFAHHFSWKLNKFRLPNGKLKYGTLTKFEKKYNVSKDCLSALAKGETYQ